MAKVHPHHPVQSVERLAPEWSPPARERAMQTGIKAIDAMIPIGRGQRE